MTITFLILGGSLFADHFPCCWFPFTVSKTSGMRWPIESCFEDGKQYVGLGDYEIRSWRGWHHHMTLCILAHFFLVRLAVRLKKVSGAYYSPSPDAFVTDVTHRSSQSIPQSGPCLLLATPQLACLSLPSQTPSRHARSPTPSVAWPDLNFPDAIQVSL